MSYLVYPCNPDHPGAGRLFDTEEAVQAFIEGEDWPDGTSFIVEEVEKVPLGFILKQDGEVLPYVCETREDAEEQAAKISGEIEIEPCCRVVPVASQTS